jgi:hypothetical protein
MDALTSNREVQTFEVWSVSKEGLAEIAIRRSGMGPTDMEQYQPTVHDVFVRWADYEQLRQNLDDAIKTAKRRLEQQQEQIERLQRERDKLVEQQLREGRHALRVENARLRAAISKCNGELGCEAYKLVGADEETAARPALAADMRCSHAVLLTQPCKYCANLSLFEDGTMRVLCLGPDGVLTRITETDTVGDPNFGQREDDAQ